MALSISKKIIIILSFISLVSCTTVKSITGPDGSENQLISCSSISSCYTKASEVCGGTYDIVNTSTDTSGSGGITSSTTRLLVKCKN